MEKLYGKMETGWCPKIVIDKDILKHLTTIKTYKTEIAKKSYTHKIIVAHWIKENELSIFLHDPEDDNSIINELKDARDCCKGIRESHARTLLKSN